MWKEKAPCDVTHPINTKDPNPRITSSSKTKKTQRNQKPHSNQKPENVTTKPQPTRERGDEKFFGISDTDHETETEENGNIR